MQFFDYWADIIVHFIQLHHNWIVPIILLIAFAESLAVISLLVPATMILLAAGALIGNGVIPFLPVWLAATVGAIAGDWLSYWLGKHYHHALITHWPLNRSPKLIYRSEQFFQRFGFSGVFIGRFFGPLRALVPLIAGAMRMPQWQFNLANVLSAPLWALIMLTPGAFGLPWLTDLLG